MNKRKRKVRPWLEAKGYSQRGSNYKAPTDRRVRRSLRKEYAQRTKDAKLHKEPTGRVKYAQPATSELQKVGLT